MIMFEKGDIVDIPFRYLLDDYQEEHREERINHPFNHREMIYGTVSVGNNRGQFFVRWNIEGIFNIDEATARDMNSVIFDEDDLILIRCKDDPEVDGDPQIGPFSLIKMNGGSSRNQKTCANRLIARTIVRC